VASLVKGHSKGLDFDWDLHLGRPDEMAMGMHSTLSGMLVASPEEEMDMDENGDGPESLPSVAEYVSPTRYNIGVVVVQPEGKHGKF
jgi:hypothetical protein